MKTFFTVGPAILNPNIPTYLDEFWAKQYGSLSHRSSAFKRIYEHTDEQLRALMNIPAESAIMFTGSASEIWEKIVLSLVEHESFHLVNGSFSTKFFEYAKSLNKHSTAFLKPPGEGFAYSEIEVPEYAELIGVTQNETSTGVQMREADIQKLKRSNLSKIMAVDMVSSAPYPDLDLSLIDTAFFSVQKSFGLPAGLGVWIANEACYERAQQLKSKAGFSDGAHHNLLSLWGPSKQFQTPATPNVLAIYLLGKVAEEMNLKGIDVIRKETDKKANKLYSFFESHPDFSIAVKEKEHRSKTVVVVDTKEPAKEIINRLDQKGFVIGSGYGKFKDSQLRISNFVNNTPEQIENLLSHF